MTYAGTPIPDLTPDQLDEAEAFCRAHLEQAQQIAAMNALALQEIAEVREARRGKLN